MKRSVILLLLALSGCTAAEVDRAPAGTADHSVYVINNERNVPTSRGTKTSPSISRTASSRRAAAFRIAPRS